VAFRKNRSLEAIVHLNSYIDRDTHPAPVDNIPHAGSFRVPVTLRDIEALKGHLPIVLEIAPGSLPVMLIPEDIASVWPSDYQLELWQTCPFLSTKACAEHSVDESTRGASEPIKELRRSLQRTLELTELLDQSGILKRATVYHRGELLTCQVIDADALEDQCAWFDDQEKGLSAVLLADRLRCSQVSLMEVDGVPMTSGRIHEQVTGA